MPPLAQLGSAGDGRGLIAHVIDAVADVAQKRYPHTDSLDS